MARNLTITVLLVAIICLQSTQGSWFGRRRTSRRSLKPSSKENEVTSTGNDDTRPTTSRSEQQAEENFINAQRDHQITSSSSEAPAGGESSLPGTATEDTDSLTAKQGEGKKLSQDDGLKLCELLQKLVSKAGCKAPQKWSLWSFKRRRCSKTRHLAKRILRLFPSLRCDIDGDGLKTTTPLDATEESTTTTETPTTESTTTTTESTTPTTTTETPTTESTTTTTESTTSTTTTTESTTPDFTCRGPRQFCVLPTGDGNCPEDAGAAFFFLSCPFSNQICCQATA